MFAFQLRRDTTTSKLKKAITAIGVVDTLEKWQACREAFSQFYAVGHDGDNYVYVYRLDNGTIVDTNLSALTQRFRNLYIDIEQNFGETHFNVNFPQKNAIKKQKAFKVTKSIHKMDLQDFLQNKIGPDQIATKVYSKIGFFPGSANASPLDKHNISLWEPSNFFFPNPDPSSPKDHSTNFCHYFKFYRHYGHLIDCVARDPIHDYHEEYPELTPIFYFFTLLFYLSGRDMEVFWYILKWIAFVIYAGKKTEIALVLVSERKGIGKSLIGEVLSRLVANSKTVLYGSFLSSTFDGDWIEKSQLMIMEESEEKAGKKTDRNVPINYLDKMKLFITSNEMTVNRKHQKPKTIANFLNFFITLNNAPYSLTEVGDRRFVVVECDSEVQTLWQKQRTEQQPYHFIKQQLIKGNNNDEFKVDSHIGVNTVLDDFSRVDVPDCDCEKEEIEIHYGLAFLSLVFYEIFKADPNFHPSTRPPLTEYHLDLQLYHSLELRIAWEFCNFKNNGGFRPNGPNWKCCDADCKLSRADHMDPDNPNWQMKHHPLGEYLTIKSYEEKPDQWEKIGIKKYKSGVSCLFSLYEFPPHSELLSKIQSQLNLQNRNCVFDLEEYFNKTK